MNAAGISRHRKPDCKLDPYDGYRAALCRRRPVLSHDYASLTCRGKRVIGKEAFYFPNLFLYCAEEIYEHVKVA